MQQDNRCKEAHGEFPVIWVEATVGQERYASEAQSGKPCEKCLYFGRSLVQDEPCGLCYESSDKPNWEEGKEHGDNEEEGRGNGPEEDGRTDRSGGDTSVSH